MATYILSDTHFGHKKILDFERFNFKSIEEGNELLWMIGNGIGGFSNHTVAGGGAQCFHGYLVAALNAPVNRTLIFTRTQEIVEVDGREYYFVTEEEFKKRIEEGKFLEYTQFVGNYYGTPLDKVNEHLEEGKEVVLEIEVDGAGQVREKMPNGVFIFVAPPTMADLKKRLKRRGTESDEVIEERFNKAKREIGLAELYDYIVVNDTVENAADKIMAIIRSEHAKTTRSLSGYK